MSIAIDTGWPPDVVRAMTPQDLAAYDAEVRSRNRKQRKGIA